MSEGERDVGARNPRSQWNSCREQKVEPSFADVTNISDPDSSITIDSTGFPGTEVQTGPAR